MNIPLDRLYHFIETIAEQIYDQRVIIYRFWPHGSKNINNLDSLHENFPWLTKVSSPAVWCHDQEPIDYEQLQCQQRISKKKLDHAYKHALQKIDAYPLPIVGLNFYKNIFAKNLLLHSELQSQNVDRFVDTGELIPVYYWSHAVIARDWFRFAQYENFKKQSNKTFLIYNRAWSGTREYRLKFADLLIEKHLLDHCKTTFNQTDNQAGVHYGQYNFKNKNFQPRHKLEDHLAPNQADSWASADFCTQDYNDTDIEVVLETLFDDTRWHLTEKILRPMACGQPFILCATAGSLKYLRSYGFKTFDTVWDETYDTIADPVQRLEAVVDLMTHICQLSDPDKQFVVSQARAIADFNKKRFFSKDFFDQVIDELKTNFAQAFAQVSHSGANQAWVHRHANLLKLDDRIQIQENLDKQDIATALTLASALERIK